MMELSYSTIIDLLKRKQAKIISIKGNTVTIETTDIHHNQFNSKFGESQLLSLKKLNLLNQNIGISAVNCHNCGLQFPLDSLWLTAIDGYTYCQYCVSELNIK